MSKFTFARYINNHSILTKLDARLKFLAEIVLIVFCFLNLNIFAYLALFGVLILFTIIGKLSFIPLLKVVRHMWFLFLILLVINVFTITGEALFNIGNVVIYKEALIETGYIILRLIMILMASNLLTACTSPDEITYAIEFYLYPLRLFKVDVHEVALMISISITFIPILFDEMDRIMKAQTSRGVDFKHGKYHQKLVAATSVVIPLFVSCFQRADDLADAMVVKGYGIGKRSKYSRFSFTYRDVIAIVVIALLLAGVILVNRMVLL